MKINNKEWHCKKKKLINKRSQNKGFTIIRMRIKFNKKKLKSNDQGLNQKIKTNLKKKIRSKINRNKKNKDQV